MILEMYRKYFSCSYMVMTMLVAIGVFCDKEDIFLWYSDIMEVI